MENLAVLLEASGGLGLFLLGMVIMTEALRSLAGNAMRSILMRFTRSPTTGALTGATTTAVLQSSSATTVAAVGFVGAGLLSFPQALGIIFGANIGTTITGWLVTLVGFKLKLGSVMLPLILLGVLLRLFGNGRAASIGLAIAGFGLIFVGIGVMQTGMQGLAQGVLGFSIPADSLYSRLQLVAIGMLFTIVTQSSSAGVAASLTALYAGTISFPQAASLVIGMDIGTTFTAVMATLGGSVATRRTGLSHLFYNLMTGIAAILLISPYIWLWENLAPGALDNNAEIGLVAFHTGFNTLGVIAVLPFAHGFARLMERLIPEQRPEITRGLDQTLLREPGVAITAIQSTLRLEACSMLDYLKHLLENKATHPQALAELKLALDETREFADAIHLRHEKDADWNRLYAVMHALDHMQRLYKRYLDSERADISRHTPQMQEILQLLGHNLDVLVDEFRRGEWEAAAQLAHTQAQQVDQQADELRDRFMGMLVSDTLGAPQAGDYLKALRWLSRVTAHIARISHYLAIIADTDGQNRSRSDPGQ